MNTKYCTIHISRGEIKNYKYSFVERGKWKKISTNYIQALMIKKVAGYFAVPYIILHTCTLCICIKWCYSI